MKEVSVSRGSTVYIFLIYSKLCIFLDRYAGPIEYESDPSSDIDKNYFSDEESLTG